MHRPHETAVRQAQMVVAMFLFGVIIAAIAAILVGPQAAPPAMGTPAASTGVATPFGTFDPLLIALFAFMIVQPPMLAALGAGFSKQAASIAASNADDPEHRDRALARAWMNASVVRGALAEGTGLFGVIVLFLTREQLGLVGVGFAVLLLLALFPTRGKLERWIERAVRHAASMPGYTSR